MAQDRPGLGAGAPRAPRRSRLTSRWCGVSAAVVAVAYGLAWLLDLQRFACVIVMTSPGSGGPGVLDACLGALFIVTYGLFWLAAPSLALAAILLAGLERVCPSPPAE